MVPCTYRTERPGRPLQIFPALYPLSVPPYQWCCMRLFSRNVPLLPALFALFTLEILFLYAESGYSAQKPGLNKAQPAQFPWSSLTLGGSKMANRLTVKMDYGPASRVATRQPWPDMSQTAHCAPARQGTNLLASNLQVAGMLRNSQYAEQLWLGADGWPVSRIRFNQDANDPWIKAYCWEKNGVRRSKVEPASNKEDLKRPAGWSQHSASWYPYPQMATSCPAISDPTQLLLLVSTLAQQSKQQSESHLSLCAFSRQHLFHVEIREESAPAQELSYQLMRAGKPAEQRSGSVQPRVYRIISRDLHAGGKADGKRDEKAEPFSLMGLEKDIRIYVDPEYAVPVRLSGTAGTLGKIELNLRAAQLN